MKFRDASENFVLILLIIVVCVLAGGGYWLGYKARDGRNSIIKKPFKVYEDLRIEPMTEQGLLGVVDGDYLEKMLKTNALKPPFNDEK
jgi:hypothetical protein